MSVTTPRTLRVGKVGDRLLRDDAIPKVTGAFDYSSDLSAPGMLWGDTLRSPHAHARIVSVGEEPDPPPRVGSGSTHIPPGSWPAEAGRRKVSFVPEM